METSSNTSGEWQSISPAPSSPLMLSSVAGSPVATHLGPLQPTDSEFTANRSESGADTPPSSSTILLDHDRTGSLPDLDLHTSIPLRDLTPDLEVASDAPPAAEPLIVLDSFIPILEKIQAALMVEENEYHLVGDPTESDWINLQAYSRTVEELSLSDTDTQAPKISNETYFRLGQLQGATSPLLPFLSRLQITNTTSSSIPHLALFFSPSLKTVKITGLINNARLMLAAFLKRAGREASLSTLVLDSINLVPEVVKGIAQCHNLETLELRNLKEMWDASSLDTIAALQHLKYLKVDARKMAGYPPNFGIQNFHRLEDFHFAGNFSTLEVIMNNLIHTSCLRSVHIELVEYDVEYDSDSEYLFKNICGHLAGSLRSLTVIFTDDEDHYYDSLPSDIISTLSLLRDLKHLEISGISIDDLDYGLSRVTSLWPKIQTLHFPVTCPSSNPEGLLLQLRTVQHIARSCPDLTSFRALITIQKGQSAAPDVLCHPLASLSVGSPDYLAINQNSMDELDHVVHCLYAMFSNLQNIETDEGKSREFWNRVHKLVKLCHDAREFDRTRALATGTSL